MKKAAYLLFLLLLSSGLLPAQADIRAIVYSTSGKVKYAPTADAKYAKLSTGAELAPEGKLNLKKGASVSIVFDTEYAQFGEAGEHTVAQIIGDIEQFRESDYAGLFSKQVKAALHPYFYAVKLKRYGFGDTSSDDPPKPPPKKEKDGAGNKNFKVVRVQPTGGKIAAPAPVFRWKPAEKRPRIKNFHFILTGDQDEVLLKKAVSGYSFTLFPGEVKLQPGASYQWRVEAAEDTDIATTNVPFTYVAADQRSDLTAALKDSKMYAQADDATRYLLEGVVLENEGFLAAAHTRYLAARRADKRNELADLMYKAFLWRYDIVE